MGIQDLIIYLRVIRKRLWLIGLLVGVTVGTILVISYTAKPVYKASVLFQGTAPPPGEVTLYSEFRSSSSREESAYTTNNFIELVRSETIAWRTIEALNLDIDAEGLLERVTVERVTGSDLVKLSVTAESSQLAASLANTLMETALEYYGELRAKSFTSSREFIGQQLDEVGNELSAAQEALTQFQIKNKVGSLNTAIDSQQSLIAKLNFERDSALAQGNMELTNNFDQVIFERNMELQGLLDLNSQYSALSAAVNRTSATYQYLLDRGTEAKLKENELSNVDFIRVIPAHDKSSRPLPRVNLKIVLLGLVVSLAFGIMIAFLLEYLETTAAAHEVSEGTLDSSPGGHRTPLPVGGEGEQRAVP